MLPPDVPRHLEHRPAVSGLPHERRGPDRQRDARPGPHPGAAKDRRLPVHDEPDDETRHEEQDRFLVEEADTDDQPAQQPQVLPSGSHDPDHQQRDERPGDEIEDRRSREVAGNQERARRERERGEGLWQPSPAQLPRDEAGQQDTRAEGERPEDAEADQRRISEERARQPREHDRQRRLVDVSPRQVARRFEEVQLVPVVAVPAADEEQDRDPGGGDRNQGTPCNLGDRTDRVLEVGSVPLTQAHAPIGCQTVFISISAVTSYGV